MEKSSQSAVDGMVLANELNNSFSQIQVSVTSTNTNMEQISEAMGQQAEVCDDIVTAIDTITVVVGETETRGGHMLKQVEEMKEIAELLDQQAKKFEI
jgi:methyl-accepting chemotaxis protein